MLGNKVVVLGGTGFVGRAVVNELSKQGYEITLCVRRPERAREFALFPNTRVVELFEMTNEKLNEVLAGHHILVNLLADRTADSETLPVEDLVDVTQKVKQVVDHVGIQRVMQLSQIGADATQQENEYLFALGESDAVIHNATAGVTVFKPGLLIGEGDETSARFKSQLNRIGLLPVYNSSVVVQPISIKEFAQALVKSIRNEATHGKKIEVVGEERMTLRELAALVREVSGKEDAWILPMCGLNAKLMSKLGRFAPVCSVSQEQRLNLACDLISDADFSTQFGFAPLGIETVIAPYVAPSDIREKYNDYRQDAGRDASELV